MKLPEKTVLLQINYFKTSETHYFASRLFTNQKVIPSNFLPKYLCSLHIIIQVRTYFHLKSENVTKLIVIKINIKAIL